MPAIAAQLEAVRCSCVTIGMSLGAAGKAVNSRGQNGARDGEAQDSRQRPLCCTFSHIPQTNFIYI